MLICVLKAEPAPATAAARTTTARQLTTPITAMFLAADALPAAQKRQCYSYPSPTPLSGETRMVSTCRSIARWLMHAGRLVGYPIRSYRPPPRARQDRNLLRKRREDQLRQKSLTDLCVFLCPIQSWLGRGTHTSTRYTDARPILRVFAISVGRMPSALILRT
jgi:hypothetical protein